MTARRMGKRVRFLGEPHLKILEPEQHSCLAASAMEAEAAGGLPLSFADVSISSLFFLFCSLTLYVFSFAAAALLAAAAAAIAASTFAAAAIECSDRP